MLIIAIDSYPIYILIFRGSFVLSHQLGWTGFPTGNALAKGQLILMLITIRMCTIISTVNHWSRAMG